MTLGFMNFIKKKNKLDNSLPVPPVEGLEMPPAPPGLDTQEDFDNFSPPPLPDMGNNQLPDFPEVRTDEYDEQDIITKVNKEKQNLPLLQPEESFFHHEEMPQYNDFQNNYEEPIEMPKKQDVNYNYQEPAPINGPLFIKAENFQKVLGRIKNTKSVIKTFEDNIFKVNELRSKEDKKYALWKSKLEDIQRKLIYVDKALFENR